MIDELVRVERFALSMIADEKGIWISFLIAPGAITCAGNYN